MQKRLDNLFSRLYRVTNELTAEAFCTAEPVPFGQKESGTYLPLRGGTRWGKGWDCAWIRLTGHIPEPKDGLLPALLLDVGGEACLYGEDGIPLKGFTNVQSEFTVALGKPAKQAFLLPAKYYGRDVTLWADAGANDLFGAKPENGIFIRAEAAYCDTASREFYYDMEVLAYTAEYATDESIRRKARACFDAAYETGDSAAVKAFLAAPSESGFTVSALGHAHLDLAWLWPIRETKRKALRTLSTVVAHMERYPDYRFGVSQPQMLAWVRESAPELYGKLKKLHREGRLELQGGMWVEADTNLPGGESLVRQLQYGMQFWEEEFGQTVRMLWLPDVFGYSAAIPQLMRQAGLPYFLTTKLSWNGVNKFPYASFRWAGTDGSEVLAHMPPEGNYNSAARADSLVRAENGATEKDICPSAMLLYGIGDGGGGPGAEHLERLEREKSLQGLPKLRQEFAETFFDRLNPVSLQLPRWEGELYLEKHQGTYTTQSRTKAGNRACERLFHEVELLGSMALCLREGFVYPKERVETLWKEVLLYQFHDILPGSCIARVYEEAEPRYRAILGELSALRAEILGCLLTGEGACLFNPSPYENADAVSDKNGYQLCKTAAKPLCFTPYTRKRGHRMHYSDTFLENSRLRVEFLPDGRIGAVIDRQTGQNTLRAPGNDLQVYIDNEDAWEVPAPEKWGDPLPMRLTSVRTSQKGGALVRTSRYVCGKSVIRQKAILREDCDRIDFETEAEWNESHRMLRVQFPLAVQSETAVCGIQFGAVRRPTHTNTTWDAAKREVCFHKYTDISDDARGAAVLSDCKYGVCVRDCTLSLALLRSPTYPGEGADLGAHRFTYAFFPHEHGVSEVIPTAYALEYPLMPVAGDCELHEPFAHAEGLCVETVKPAEDGRGIIVRLYNPLNCRVETTVHTAPVLGFTACRRTDLREKEIGQLPLCPTLSVGAYEVVTLRFEK